MVEKEVRELWEDTRQRRRKHFQNAQTDGVSFVPYHFEDGRETGLRDALNLLTRARTYVEANTPNT
jgi:hypothetical protein